MKMECHKCPYNNKQDEHCLQCIANEEYDYSYDKDRYILDTYDPPQPSTKGNEKMTTLDDETEDKLRYCLIQLFRDLTPIQILLVGMIMKGDMGLTEIGQEMKQIIDKIKDSDEYSRHRVFQNRLRIIKKFPWLKKVLLTKGQRRHLKG